MLPFTSTISYTLANLIDASVDFDFVDKDVCGNTAIPFNANKFTPEVIDDTLNGSLGESSDQPSVGSDLFRGPASHAYLAPVDHLRIPPSNQRTPSRRRLRVTGSSMPRDLFVHNNLLTILVYLDDRITPTQLRFNMSQMVRNFRPDCIMSSERLI